MAMYILAVPAIILLLAILAVIAAVRKAWVRVGVWTALCLALNLWSQTFALHPFSCTVQAEKSPNVLRVMSYNLWGDSPYLAEYKKNHAEELLNSIDSMNVDVLVLVELYYEKNGELVDTLSKMFPYNMHDLKYWGDENGMQVFSKYPLKKYRHFCCYDEQGNKQYPPTSFFSMQVEEQEVKMVACHLASNNYTEDRERVEKGNKNYLKALNAGYSKRKLEADGLRDSLDCFDLPKLVIGDFNDISGSYAVRTVMGNDMVDAWWKGGLGYGATYCDNILNCRIDHILYSKNDFELLGVKVLKDWRFSDHYPVVADFMFIP